MQLKSNSVVANPSARATWKTNRRFARVCFAALAAAPAGLIATHAAAQTSISLTGADYSQDFNTLPLTPAAGSLSFTNGSTLAGWYQARSNQNASTLSPGNTGASDGNTNSGGLYYFGTPAASTERALGTIGSGTPGHIAFGAQFVNNAAGVIDSITVTYTGEEWRNSGDNAAQKLFFNYRVGGANFDVPPQTGSPTGASNTDTDTSTFTNVAALDFESPVIGGGTAVSALGNTAPYQTLKTSTIDLSSAPIVQGTNFWLRFYDPNHGGNDHGLAVDDFKISYTIINTPGADSVITNTGPSTVSLGRVSTNTTFSIPLSKTGNDLTSYQANPSPGSNLSAAGSVFQTGPQTGSVTVSFSGGGTLNGSVTIHNNATASAGVGQGTADPDDVINVDGDAVADRVVSSNVALGGVLKGLTLTGTATFGTTGSDSQATRVTMLQAGSFFSSSTATVQIADGTSDKLFNDAAVTEARGYTLTFLRSSAPNPFLDMDHNGEGLTGEVVQPLRAVWTATVYQPAQLSVTGVNATNNVGDVFTIVNAASDDDVVGATNFGLRAGARVSALNIEENGFRLLSSGSTVTGSPTTGTVIGSPSGNAAGGTVVATVSFSGANKLNGTYDSIIAAQFQHSDQTIKGTAAHDLAANDFSTVAHAVNTLNVGDTHAGSYTFTGGTFVAQPTINLTGSWTQSGGKATFGTLLVGPTGLAKQTAGRSAARTDVIGSLTISAGGKFDTADQDLILTGTPIANVKTMIAGGAGPSGNWTGSGLTSSSAAAAAGGLHPTALGYANAGSLSIATFNNISVSPSDVVVRYTYRGDTNLDGSVNTMDFNTLATNFNATGKNWIDGDVNYDGTVNALDFNYIAVNYGAAAINTPPAPALGALVPEPGSMMMCLAGLGLLQRKRRR